ncbi:kinesin K39, partial [Lotmaria passim]
MVRPSATKRVEQRVRVSVRVRPLNPREQKAAEGSLITVTANQQTSVVSVTPVSSIGNDATEDGVVGNRRSTQDFQFDHVFWSVDKPDASGGSPATQADVFETIGLPLVQHAFDGFNSCLFAYGQTGSGKTYTMMGADVNALGGEGSGVTPRICLEIFARKASVEAEGHSRWSVELGYVEVYNERVSDLLGRRRKGAKAADEVYVEVREHPSRGVFLEGQRLVEVKSLDDVVKLIELGNGVRHTAATKMNDRSSRSHAIIMLLLREERTMTTKAGETIKTVGKNSRMNLVDLAGSERVAQSQVEGQQFKEATHINLSLTTLGRVIDMLADMAKKKSKSQWTLPPYRDAKLTFILKDSLGGNSKTFMIATVSPSAMNYEETLSTLRYASRARDIVNVAQVNEDPRARRIRELEEQMANMRLNMAGGDPARIAELEEKLALLESEAQKRAADLQALEKERQKNEIRDLMLKATEAERLELLEKADLLEQQVADSRAQADRMEEENRRMLVLQKEKDALLRAREASLDNHRQEMQRRECSMENHREEWQMKMEEEQRLRQATLLELHEAEERGFHVRNFYHDFVCELRRSYGAMIRDALQRGVELQRTTTRQLEEATAAAQSRKKENDELKIDLKQCEADAAELRRKLEKAESELKAAAKAAMDAADQKRVDDEKAQHHLEALNSKLEATSRASAAAAMEITALRQELDATRREVDAATRDRDATADEKAQLQTALKDKTSEADDVTAALEDLRAKFEAAQQQILATTQSLHVADDAKAQLTDELAANSAALGEARTANEVLAQQMAAAADALTQAQAQHAAALDAIAKEAAKNDNLTEQLTQMKVAEKALEQQLSEQQRAAHELARYDERWNFPATDEPTTTSSHTKVFPQEEWSIILQEKPRELDRTFRHDVALACHIRPSGITRLKFTLGSLHATFYVQHPKTMTSKEIAARLDGYPFRGMQQLYERRNDPPFGLDALALENEQLRSQKDTDGAQINKLQQDNQAISSAFETATAEKERLQSELEEKGSEADAAKEDNEVLRGQLEDAQQRIEEATAEKER